MTEFRKKILSLAGMTLLKYQRAKAQIHLYRTTPTTQDNVLLHQVAMLSFFISTTILIINLKQHKV